MTKAHAYAYLARIKDQEKDVVAVPDGAGRALCVSFDKHWTLSREWDDLHIIAPLVEDEGNDDEPDPLTQEGLGHVLQQLAEAKSEAARWEQNYLDADTKARHATVEADDLKGQVKSEQAQNERLRKALAGSRDAHQRTVQAHETMKRAFDLSQERVLELKRELNAAIEGRNEQKARAEQAGRDRDEWREKAYSASEGMRKAVARAEAAERERDALDDRLVQVDMELSRAVAIPPVSRADIEKAIWEVYNRQECELRQDWPGRYWLTEAVCDLFGVEAEAAVDPVEAKARELRDAAQPDAGLMWEAISATAQEQYRRMARHVLGQEDRDVDQ